MNRIMMLMAVALLTCAGCATRSTVETRRQERFGVYSDLKPEMQQLVDGGKIAVGMPMEAVYIAWGKPSSIGMSETPQGRQEIWLYYGTTLRSVHYWSYRHGGYRRGYYYSMPIYETDYYPQSYVSAEVVFEEGTVKRWRLMPHPSY